MFTNPPIISNKTMPSPKTKNLQASINKNTKVFIQSLHNEIKFDQPTYAINWFNTRQLWLYNIYNLLASRSVTKIKGVPFFKGLVKETLYGEDQYRRDVLLIVYYPSCYAFKSMLESVYFQLVSVLRMAAIKSFSFGFFLPQKKLKIPEPDQCSTYFFHHFSGNGIDENRHIINQLQQAINASQNNAKILFEGSVGAHLYSGDQHLSKEKIPCIMDAAIVVQAESINILKKIISDPSYQEVITKTQHSFIATLQRVI